MEWSCKIYSELFCSKIIIQACRNLLFPWQLNLMSFENQEIRSQKLLIIVCTGVAHIILHRCGLMLCFTNQFLMKKEVMRISHVDKKEKKRCHQSCAFPCMVLQSCSSNPKIPIVIREKLITDWLINIKVLRNWMNQT